MQQKELMFLLAQIIAICTKHYLQTNGNKDTTYAYTCDDNRLVPSYKGRGSYITYWRYNHINIF